MNGSASLKLMGLVKVVLSIVVFLIFLQTVPAISAASNEISKTVLYDTKAVVIGEAAIAARVADSDSKRIKGLSGSEPLKSDEGMLFIFPKSEQHGIWMKDMNYPIDIIWIDKHYTVIHIEHSVSPDTFPKVFDAPKDSLYVVETKAGFVKSKSIRKGDLVNIF